MIQSFIFHTWYGAVLFVVLTGHLTITCVSLYLHRAMTHNGITLHPLISWPMRWWLWIFTGMSTREWVSVHRKHHAFVETEEDPHSPVIHGWASILFFGVKYYRKASHDKNTLERYSQGCPNDVIERKLFVPNKFLGPIVLLVIDLLLFGALVGAFVWVGQVLWVPFWAAGIVNGLGHTIGYRNYTVKDASRNLVPFGLLLSGEELHNNHHKFPGSAKFSKRGFEVDLGWWYIRFLCLIGLAKVQVAQGSVLNFHHDAYAEKESIVPAKAVVRSAAEAKS